MKSPSKPSKKTFFVTLALLIVVFLLGVILEVKGVTHFFHKSPDPETSKTETTGGASAFSDKGEVTKTPSSESSSGQSNTYAGAKTDGNNGASTTLLAPSGTFVSAHKQVPSNAPLTSVCNTTPGATCQIVFTSGSLARTLEARTADSNGAVYWDRWTPSSIGLTPGVWHVQAKTSLNGQSKTADDALTLEIVS